MSDLAKSGGGQSPGDPPPTNPFNALLFETSVVCLKRIADGKCLAGDVALVLGAAPFLHGGGQGPGDPPPTGPE